MSDILSGVRILEVASWTFVPAAGAILADWGADVIKIEHPVTGDPQRGLMRSGLVPAAVGGFNYMMEQPNRGKRSVGLNLASTDGRDLQLVADPVQFDETLPVLRRGPDHDQHTEEVLLELGPSWHKLIVHKESGAIL